MSTISGLYKALGLGIKIGRGLCFFASCCFKGWVLGCPPPGMVVSLGSCIPI